MNVEVKEIRGLDNLLYINFENIEFSVDVVGGRQHIMVWVDEKTASRLADLINSTLQDRNIRREKCPKEL